MPRELTGYYKVVQLIALGVEVFLHPRDVGIGDVLLAEELKMYGQYPIPSTESYRVMCYPAKNCVGLCELPCVFFCMRVGVLLTTQTAEDEDSQVKLAK
jgi:hypothetical protein